MTLDAACRSSSGRSTHQHHHGARDAGARAVAAARRPRSRASTSASSIPRVGGDPVLFQHLFWFYSHPAVYIMILPAMGVISEVVPHVRAQAARRRTRRSPSRRSASRSSASSPGATTCSSPACRRSTPASSACCRCSWRSSRPSRCSPGSRRCTGARSTFDTPLLYFFAFLFLFVFGGMTGVAVATQSLDVHWHDTYFVVAHFHFIMVGGTLTAFLAAAHYWFPKMSGRMLLRARRACSSATRGVHRLRPHVHAAVPARQRGHAAPLLQLPGAVPVAARAVDRRRVPARRARCCSRSATCSSRCAGAARAGRTRGARAASSG